jgi:hypothetical protein
MGSQRKAATLVTSDITKGNSKLTLHSNVRPVDDSLSPMKVDPPIVDITKDRRGDKFDVTITNLTDLTLTPHLVATPIDGFDYTYTESPIEPGKSAGLTVWVDKTFEAATAKKSFTFELNDPKRSRFSVPVQVTTDVGTPLKAAAGGK